MESVKRNIGWSLLGSVLPLIAGIILFPLIIDAYGLERFGLLTLIWALVGYFGLFDLGLSRALTQQVSSLLTIKNNANAVSELIKTGFRALWLLGFLGGCALWFLSPYLVSDLLKISPALQQDTISAFSILALSIPIVVHTSAMRGVLEALHLFKVISIIRSVLGVGAFLAPYITSLYSDSLVVAVCGLIFVRILVWLMHLVAIRKSEVLIQGGVSFALKYLHPLLHFGGWMTVTNIISPLMVYLDRFFIVAVIGASASAFYVGPYEVITKMLVFPAAISGVLFPLFAKEWKLEPEKSAIRLNTGIRYTLLGLFPVSVLLVYFSSEWLSIWLGEQFVAEGRLVVIWLVAGVFVNAAASIIFAKVQGAGRSDWTAKLHLIELIPYLALLWWSLHLWGIAGAAFAWFARVSFDMLGLIYFMTEINKNNLHQARYTLFLFVLSTLALLIALIPLSFEMRILTTIILSLAYVYFAIKQLKQDNILSNMRAYLTR